MPQPAPIDDEAFPDRPDRGKGKPKKPRNPGREVGGLATKMPHRMAKKSRAPPRKCAALSSLLQSASSPLKRTSKRRGDEGRDSILNFIKCIMYTFGDVQEPMDSAAAAVSSALESQITLAHRIASTARRLRATEDSQLEVIDLFVAYRHNFPLLHRVFKRLQNRSEARRAARDITQPDTGDKVLRELKEALEKFHKDDLEKVSDPALVDPLYLSRLVKMDQQTQKMDQEEYLQFHKARSTSFVSSVAARRVFQEFLKKNRSSNLSSSAVELLATIAYEIVARITEVATQIRGIEERPPPKFCKPKFQNPLFCDGDEATRKLLPQSRLRRYYQYGLEQDDVEKAVRKLIEDVAPGSHDIKEMRDIRLF